MSKLLFFASLTALLSSAVAGCGDEFVDYGVVTASDEALSSLPAARFKNDKYSTCIESSPLRMASCSSSVTQRIIGDIVGFNGAMNLRFEGTNTCLKQVDSKSVTTGECGGSSRKLWIPSGSSLEIKFKSVKNGRYLKASPALKVGNPDGKSLWRVSKNWNWGSHPGGGGNENGGDTGSDGEGDAGDGADK